MINADLIAAVKAHTAKMSADVTFVVANGEHDKRSELLAFLQSYCNASDRLHLVIADFAGARSGVSFAVYKGDARQVQDLLDGKESPATPTGIVFSGIPGGHEFTSLVLATLQAGGVPLKLDQSVQDIVRGIGQELKFETFVSLSCHNCPDVVQTLNAFALLNPNISSEMIDGGCFQAEVDKRGLQGVPCVFLNGREFANGRIDTAKILEKLFEKFPELLAKAAPAEKLPTQDVVVIGGGPAGAAAAIYAARKGLKVTVIADRIGGQIKDTLGIENLIGHKYITGTQLAGQLREHIDLYNITIREGVLVERIIKASEKQALAKAEGKEASDNVHTLLLRTTEEIDTRTIIIAAGAKWRELGVPGEKENLGKGVAYCPHCDGPFFKGKSVAVIGGGNSGVEAALDLAGIVKHVTVFEFNESLRADKILVDAAQKKSNITILTSSAVTEVKSNRSGVTGIAYRDRLSNDLREVPLSGVFVQIGLVPNTSFLGDVVERTRVGEIIVNHRCETSEPGIFAAGDCTTVPYKQIIVAMGEGAKSALSAFEYLLRSEQEKQQKQQADSDS